mmetsp:Transcript_6099/g.18432  ORF Transcript_6099/g.18432 Transcript_6099/m.18432 type:complete len:96 (-) Transcript_6099:917-1204(-)
MMKYSRYIWPTPSAKRKKQLQSASKEAQIPMPQLRTMKTRFLRAKTFAISLQLLAAAVQMHRTVGPLDQTSKVLPKRTKSDEPVFILADDFFAIY